ncbi:MAG TPA: helicase-related protein [Candidatus Baltobacteraceae bacterium]|jgi:single-stranded-DNA-specific exonuclease|nr:helicase-related protein [Candidatus Baltobacteraceae bacterium]
MSGSSTARKPLPPPTKSEAAFERLLRDFGTQIPRAERAASPAEETIDEFIERLFSQNRTFLKPDDFAGIGDRESFPTKVMGVSFEGRQHLVAGLVPGSELELRRQPDNPHDANAIAVCFGTLQIGYLRKQIAKHLAPLIDGGVRYRAIIQHVTGTSGFSDEKKFRGVNIRVEREPSVRADPFAVQVRAQADHEALRAALIGSAHPHEAQQAVLARIDAGRNTLAVMGTGRGKSFCFQYPAAFRALESSQKTLVIYPLRALANDQHDALVRRLDGLGLRIFRANGSISAEERTALMGALSTGAWDIVLATPEFLQFHREAFTGSSRPAFVVVDEAHHLYESKHRAAYGRLGETIAALGRPQILALTATAGDDAFKQICKDLAIDAWVIDPTVRENLHVVDARGTRDKIAYLKELFDRSDAEDSAEKGIVYCNSRSEATKTAQALRKQFDNSVMFYHAGMPSSERAQVEDLFRAGRLRIIVATSAFGEGIDLPDVRHVVLYHLNFDFTEFNQQAGRAGRDGEAAGIHLLFNERDRRINEFIIDQEAPTLNVMRAIYRGLRGLASGDVIRMSFADIARTLDLDKANERTISVAVHIFEDEGLIESDIDDDGRFMRLRHVDGKVDLTKNERFAEGEAAREDFARFCELILSADPHVLERIINRPIYPERTELRR